MASTECFFSDSSLIFKAHHWISTAADLGVEMAYVAMFDEVDEATAIFKVSNSPPKPGRFVTHDGPPSDWYLRLTGEGTKLICGERENQKTIPIKP